MRQREVKLTDTVLENWGKLDDVQKVHLLDLIKVEGHPMINKI